MVQPDVNEIQTLASAKTTQHRWAPCCCYYITMDFVLSGISACGACFFTNPLEVVKTRMQLQGELKTRGTYQVYYRNVFHAFYTIGKVDGIAGLQKGLAPGLVYQFFMNGVRLGSYAIIESSGYIHTDGKVSAAKSIVAGAVAGVVGAYIGSPIYLVSECKMTCQLCLPKDYCRTSQPHLRLRGNLFWLAKWHLEWWQERVEEGDNSVDKTTGKWLLTKMHMRVIASLYIVHWRKTDDYALLLPRWKHIFRVKQHPPLLLGISTNIRWD